MLRNVCLIFLFVLASCAPESESELDQWKRQAENVTIYRDDFGVPHIYGKTDADAVFGLLYAQCEDDFRRVERNFTWAIGRLAEEKGEEQLYSDLRARLFMTEEEARAYYASAPDWLKALCQAWADGINYYLYTHPEITPSVIKRYEPWMTMYFTEGSIGGDIERVSTDQIKAFYDGTTTAERNEKSPHQYPLEEPQGSNGFALSGKMTASGNTMLLINPHTSFYFRGEVHVVSDEGLNAYGAVTWGQFFVYQGFNEQTGWMHTSTYTDVIDEFVETIVRDGDDLFYRYGEELLPIEQQEVTLKYKSGDEMMERSFPIYRTHHGPITHVVDGRWTATAMMWEPVKALEQSFIRTKQRNLEAFDKMMEMRTNSSNNTVFADREGNIAYYHGNFIPIRDEQFDYTLPVDGSNPATDWQGLHAVEEAITVKNPPNGWIQNCNSTPFTSAGTYSPKKEDYPSYMSRISENHRGVNAQRLLAEAKDLTLDQLITLAYDPYLAGFEKIIPGLIRAFENSNKDKTMWDAIDLLKKWDFTTGVDSRAMSLAHFYGMQLLNEVEIPDEWGELERYAHYGDGLPEVERLRLFKAAMNEMDRRYGTWIIPWGEINRFQRISGAIEASFDDDAPSIPVGITTAKWGHLAAYGMRGTHDVNKIYGTRGNSFVAAVEFGDQVRAKTLLAGGQSGDPNSSHFDDQASMYANGEFKEAAYYREDVEARAEEVYQPGKR